MPALLPKHTHSSSSSSSSRWVRSDVISVRRSVDDYYTVKLHAPRGAFSRNNAVMSPQREDRLMPPTDVCCVVSLYRIISCHVLGLHGT